MSLISGSSDSAKECRSVAISVDGLMFSRQRECVLSGNKNTDINPVKLGAYSFEEGKAEYKYVIWNRGTSTAPKGRYDRISVLTWQHGGFAYVDPNIETFAAKLRLDENKTLLKEFKSAYAAMVEIIDEGNGLSGPELVRQGGLCSSRVKRACSSKLPVFDQKGDVFGKFSGSGKSEHRGLGLGLWTVDTALTAATGKAGSAGLKWLKRTNNRASLATWWFKVPIKLSCTD